MMSLFSWSCFAKNWRRLKEGEIKGSVSTYRDSVEMLSHVEKYDVIFLDVDMPQVSGENIAAYIKENKLRARVIFVTSHDEFVFSSFRYRPFGYIRKSHIDSELLSVIKDIKDYFEVKKEFFICSTRGNTLYFEYKDIRFLESYSHEIIIHTTSGDYAFNDTLSGLEKKLPSDRFIRTHHSYLVNCDYIFSIEKDRVILSTEQSVPLSRKRISEVKHKMMVYVRG